MRVSEQGIAATAVVQDAVLFGEDARLQCAQKVHVLSAPATLLPALISTQKHISIRGMSGAKDDEGSCSLLLPACYLP